MDGVGNESLFDFETAYGDPFPDGNPVPFSIVAYIDQDWSSAAAGGFTLLSKTDETGDGQFTGWVFAGNQDFPTRFDFSMQAGNNVDRLAKADEMVVYLDGAHAVYLLAIAIGNLGTSATRR